VIFHSNHSVLLAPLEQVEKHFLRIFCTLRFLIFGSMLFFINYVASESTASGVIHFTRVYALFDLEITRAARPFSLPR
jgi:hypothetical protein